MMQRIGNQTYNAYRKTRNIENGYRSIQQIGNLVKDEITADFVEDDNFSTGVISNSAIDKGEPAVLEAEVVFPQISGSNGILWEFGGTFSGARAVLNDNGNVFELETGGDSTPNMKVATSNVPRDGIGHKVTLYINPSEAIMAVWIDDELVGLDTNSPDIQFAGDSDGGYTTGGEDTGVNDNITADWPGSVNSNLFYYNRFIFGLDYSDKNAGFAVDKTVSKSGTFSGSFFGHSKDHVFWCDVTFPTSETASGVLFEDGGDHGTGLILDGNGNLQLKITDSSDTTQVDVSTTAWPKDGLTHEVLWSVAPSDGTGKLFIDNVGVASGSGSFSSWAGGDGGGYGTKGGADTGGGLTGTTTANWPGTLESQLNVAVDEKL
jgi:hypothetical protein